jgi:hypothetical protein
METGAAGHAANTAQQASRGETLGAWMVKLAARHGFQLSPPLLRVLEARVGDPALARWLNLLGHEL